MKFMQNLITQHHCKRDFEWPRDRFTAYNAEFGYDNHACYFLADYGQAPDGDDDAIPTMVSVDGRVTPTSVPIHEALPSRKRKRLNKYEFTPPKPGPGREDRLVSATEMRERIWEQLRYDRRISDIDFKFLKESPEQAVWLEKKMEPRFWLRLKSLEEAWQKKQERLSDYTDMWDCEYSEAAISLQRRHQQRFSKDVTNPK